MENIPQEVPRKLFRLKFSYNLHHVANVLNGVGRKEGSDVEVENGLIIVLQNDVEKLPFQISRSFQGLRLECRIAPFLQYAIKDDLVQQQIGGRSSCSLNLSGVLWYGSYDVFKE